MKKEDFKLEEKACVKILGMSLETYRKSLEKIVAPKFEKETKEKNK